MGADTVGGVPASGRLVAGAFVIAAVLLAGGARAATPCAPDIEKFCPNVPIGEGRIQACLKEHESELSPECAGRHEHVAKEAADLVAVCRYDIRRFCWDVSPGRGRIARCIQRHRGDLSATCEHRLRKAEQPRSE